MQSFLLEFFLKKNLLVNLNGSLRNDLDAFLFLILNQQLFSQKIGGLYGE